MSGYKELAGFLSKIYLRRLPLAVLVTEKWNPRVEDADTLARASISARLTSLGSAAKSAHLVAATLPNGFEMAPVDLATYPEDQWALFEAGLPAATARINKVTYDQAIHVINIARVVVPVVHGHAQASLDRTLVDRTAV